MERRYFGTDGVRGRANAEPMTAQTALLLGMAAGTRFQRGEYRHSVVIGKDTRLSGYMIEPALTSGFVSVGMDVILVGPLPTPAISMLTRSLRADLGVMISASHNPFHDNGIKLFGPDGAKLSDATETEIERLMDAGCADVLAGSKALGRARRIDDAGGRYIEAVKQTFPRGLRLDGLKVVVDCANGASYKVAPAVLWELGAEVVKIGVAPNGFNINEGCGSQHPEHLSRTVIEQGADIGVAFDGDADRLVLCDELGKIVNGDQILGLIARAWKRRDALSGDAVVATIMSNLGLERFLNRQGLRLERTAVGDRYVSERMREGGFNLGGESSGHIVLGNLSPTGDGLCAALQVLAELVQGDIPASSLFHVFEPCPQRLRNVPIPSREEADRLLGDAVVKAALEEWDRQLGRNGRVVLRKSGTEPLVRIMAEAEDPAVVDEIIASLDDLLTRQARAAS